MNTSCKGMVMNTVSGLILTGTGMLMSYLFDKLIC